MIRKLLAWYKTHGRELPWRGSRDPYDVWLSEIILQQTRVEQGMPYYHAMLEAYPTVHDMATAPDDEVYSLWQGLGYYNRCQNMLKTARHVSLERDGIFPTDYDGLLQLSGVGPYTAAAISSICYSEPRLAIDGNLKRVLSRVYGITDDVMSAAAHQKFMDIESSILEGHDAGEVNQALMDIGSQICKPKNPSCADCPLRAGCYAYEHDMTAVLPVKAQKKKKKNHYLHYAVPLEQDRIWIRKRAQSGIWQNLYEFHKLHDAEQPYEGESVDTVEHHLTHKKLHISFEYSDASSAPADEGMWVAEESVTDYALPVPLMNWWKKHAQE